MTVPSHVGRTVDIGLLPHQAAAFEAPEPFVAMVTGLGGGKTWAGALWLVMRCIAFPESLHLATGNTFRQTLRTVVPALERACELLGVAYVFKKADSEFHLLLGGDAPTVIYVASTTNYDTLRGIEIASWWGDEVRDSPKAAIDVLVGRLRDQRADVCRYLWTTTPNGFDHVYERHVEAEDPDCRLVSGVSTADNPFLPAEYIASLEASYDPFMLQQERDGKFLNLTGGLLYNAFDRAANVSELVTLNPSEPVIICLDNNPDPLAMVLVQHGPRGQIWAIDEVAIRQGTLSQASEVIRSAIGRDHDAGLLLYGDAVGKQKSAQTGRSDYAALQAELETWYGGRIVSRARRQNPGIIDRVNAVNGLLHTPALGRRLFLSPRCKELRRDFERVPPKQGIRHPDKNKDHDRTHWSDAVGYYIAIEHPCERWNRDRSAMERLSR